MADTQVGLDAHSKPLIRPFTTGEFDSPPDFSPEERPRRKERRAEPLIRSRFTTEELGSP
eukprot:1014782-Prorocentrum_minimum.AAC.1